MKLKGFQVYKYRNIIDSGWIKVDSIAALVGQNECGKSNLLRAFHKFSPFDEAKYEIDSDWPIDEWATKKAGVSAVVCEARFSLVDDEIKKLFSHAIKSEDVEEELTDEQSDEESQNNLSDEETEDEIDLPDSFEVLVKKTYQNRYLIEFLDDITDSLEETKAKEWVEKNLPKCVYMDDYLAFTGHHADIASLAERANNSNNITPEESTILIALDLAVLDLQDIVDKGTTEEGHTQRAFDTNAASGHLSKLFKDKWDQKDVKFDIRVDANNLDIFVEDEGLDAFVELAARSRGFQWYVSFVWRFTHASRGEFEDCILLLDEPGIHLHHAGHKNLLEFLEKLSETNTVLYTTHLSTMIDAGYPERVRIMEVYDHHASVTNSMVSKQKKPMMVIEAVLGLSGSMGGLLGSRQNLIVEGGEDAVILHKLSSVLQNSAEEGLSDRIFLLPADGAPKTPMFAGFMVGNEFDAGVLLDSDKAGEEAKAKINDMYLKNLSKERKGKFRILMLGDAAGIRQNESAIEDLFPAEFYLECVNEAYRTNITKENLPDEGSDQICKKVEKVLQQMNRATKLDKSRVMDAIQKRFNNIKAKDDLPEGTYEKTSKLIKKINAAFNGESKDDEKKPATHAAARKKTS